MGITVSFQRPDGQAVSRYLAKPCANATLNATTARVGDPR